MNITGIGLVTPLGANALQTWSALLEGQFIRDHARALSTSDGAARIHDMAARAAGEATAQARWVHRPIAPGSTALVVGTSKGAVETWLSPLSTLSDVGHCGLPDDSWGLSSIAAMLRNRSAGIDGPALTISAACASGLHALIRAAMMIRSGEAQRVLVVAAEASVHPMFLGSFRRLGVLPREGVGCRPFDEMRDGFLMSEAAAAVCLEAAESCGSSAATAMARIDRFALGGDASHMTGLDPGGQVLCRLLRRVVDGLPLDLIHAHGTGTMLNDPLELAAFECECLLDDHSPLVYSHKGAIGHSLGASGLVATVLNCMMHSRSVVLPNVQTRRPLPTRLGLRVNAQAAPVRRSLALAAGFGGPMAAVSLVSP